MKTKISTILPTVIIDKQEKTPFVFSHLPTVIGHLRTGDYSLVGLKHLVRWERKRGDDCVASISRHRDRFEAEIIDLVAFPWHMLVIEMTPGMIAQGYDYCRKCDATGVVQRDGQERTCHKCNGQRVVKWRHDVTPNAVYGTLTSWIARYELRVWCGGRHTECSRFVEESLEKAAIEIQRRMQATGAETDATFLS